MRMKKNAGRMILIALISLCAALGFGATNTIDTLVSGQARIWSSVTTTSKALDVNLAAEAVKEIHEVRVHLGDAASSGTITIKIDSVGSYWDVVLAKETFSGSFSDYVFRPARPVILKKTDKLNVYYNNLGGKVCGVEIIWRYS